MNSVTKTSNITRPGADLVQAHADFLTARQRESGIRVRLCSSGCYSLYSAGGEYIGRTAPQDAVPTLRPSQQKTSAARMAYAEEMANALRLVDMDFENTGTVSTETIARVRALLGAIGNV